VIVAVPVAAATTVQHMKRCADEVVVLDIPPEPFLAIGYYYENFAQVTDEEVLSLMRTNSSKQPALT
jgi:putative phosphoribosyl transferase